MVVSRQVKGVLFVDYVRMLRACKMVEWGQRFQAEDLALLRERITPDAWYPMATFERFGLAILEHVTGGDLELVRAWGRQSVDELLRLYDGLLNAGDPRDSLMRFQVLRSSFFDFEAITVRELFDTEVRLRVNYGMSPAAEEAASYQAMGFFERLIELAGGTNITARFLARSWAGDPETSLVVTWTRPHSS